jgi:hypothetical protein
LKYSEKYASSVLSSATGLLGAAEGFTDGDGFGVADGDADGFTEAEGEGFTEADAEADGDGFAEADAEADGLTDGEDDGLAEGDDAADACGNSGLPLPDDVEWPGLADGSFDGTAQAHKRSAQSARIIAKTFFINTPHNRCILPDGIPAFLLRLSHNRGQEKMPMTETTFCH